MPFQLNSKNLFLTYPRCPASIDDLLQHLVTLLPGANIVVAAEPHADGSPHVHSLICCLTPFRTRNERFFDYLTYHPNVQGCRNLSDVYTYVTKGGNFITHGSFDFELKRCWRDVLTCATAEEAVSLVKETYPRDWVLNKERIEYFVRTSFTTPIPLYAPNPEHSFVNVMPDMTSFCNQRFEVTLFRGGAPVPSARNALQSPQTF